MNEVRLALTQRVCEDRSIRKSRSLAFPSMRPRSRLRLDRAGFASGMKDLVWDIGHGCRVAGTILIRMSLLIQHQTSTRYLAF